MVTFNNESSGNNAPNSTAHDKDKIFDATLRGNMMMVGSTETGKTHLAVKTIENGLWGPGLTTVYWFSPNELSDRDMQEKCVGISRSITILFIAIASPKALSSAIADMQTDITRLYDKDRTKSFLIVDDLMDVIVRCDAFGALMTNCRHIGRSTITMYQAITRPKRAWEAIKANSPLLRFFRMGMGNVKLVNLMTSAVASSTPSTKSNHWITQVYQEVTKRQHGYIFIDIRATRPFDISSIHTNITSLTNSTPTEKTLIHPVTIKSIPVSEFPIKADFFPY